MQTSQSLAFICIRAISGEMEAHVKLEVITAARAVVLAMSNGSRSQYHIKLQSTFRSNPAGTFSVHPGVHVFTGGVLPCSQLTLEIFQTD